MKINQFSVSFPDSWTHPNRDLHGEGFTVLVLTLAVKRTMRVLLSTDKYNNADELNQFLHARFQFKNKLKTLLFVRVCFQRVVRE